MVRPFLWSFFFTLYGCSEQVMPENFPYDLSTASITNKLPKELREISGMSFLSKKKLYCVQDEKGIVYIYDLKKNVVHEKIHFGKNDDFEGVTAAGENLYALKSNGTLFKIQNFKHDDKAKAMKINTFLNKKFDCEGLCFDKKNNQLLVACKGSPNEKKFYKYVYCFDIKTQKLIKKPYLKIRIDDVHAMKKSSNTQKIYDKAIHKAGGNNTVFNPSGIAVHPITNDIYILSAEGNTLVVMNEKKKMIYAVHLKKSLFMQPEGITFGSNGTMYISNEGHGQKATVKSFKYNSN